MSMDGFIWAWHADDLTPAAKLLLLHLADNVCDAEPHYFPRERLLEFVGVDDLSPLLRELVAKERISFLGENREQVLLCVWAPWQDQQRCSGGDNRPKLSLQLRAAIYRRDGMACVVCASEDRLTIDHIVPLSKGGTNKAENLQTLCSPCNTSKGDRDFEEWRARRLQSLGLASADG